MVPFIKAGGLTKVFPVDPLDHLGYLTFERALRGPAPALRPAREKVAVNDVSFEFSAGDRIGIIGRNGAGKSTLLSLIAGMIEPTSGTVTVDGHVTAVMTLGVGLREDLSGRENIYVDGEIQGRVRSEVDLLIEEIIAFAELGEFIEYPVRTYSTGMKARLAFAMLIHLEPEILIIDEALSVGDAFFSQKATRKIREICERGKLVIIVSHGMPSINELCNRCLWMEDGRIRMNGKPHLVTAAYLDAVRQEDEKELQQRFRHLLGAVSTRSGATLSEIRLAALDHGGTRAIFPIGSACRLSFDVNVDAPLAEVRLVARFMRIDGLLVGESVLDAAGAGVDFGRVGSYSFEADLAPLIFARGVFQVTVELADRRGALATASTIIEMQSREPEIGGRPLLVLPGHVHAAPML